ncbi:DNA-directed RNA polymerase subunit alpha, partial [Candidatus Azambacteria bacterium]|nr:DNA-directed RNA polymerase subunit alpha [Candidatus Azambacteria bacterium]
VQILLNLKQLRLRVHSDEPQKIYIKAHGERNISGKDVEGPSQVEIVNPTLHIATLSDKKTVFEVEMTVEKGFGYVPVEARKKEKLEVGTMALDAIFTPIRKINYDVENMRVGERTDFDRVRFSIETDGTVDPEEAFLKAARIVVEQFQELASSDAEKELLSASKKSQVEGEGEKIGAALSNLGLSARVANALAAAGITGAGDLTSKTEDEILAYEGMGVKGVTEIKKALKKAGLSLKEK